jgi:hypothetical protein
VRKLDSGIVTVVRQAEPGSAAALYCSATATVPRDSSSVLLAVCKSLSLLVSLVRAESHCRTVPVDDCRTVQCKSYLVGTLRSSARKPRRWRSRGALHMGPLRGKENPERTLRKRHSVNG